MKTHIRIGRFLGIEVGLHLSWFIIALLLTLALADQFRAVNPQWGVAAIWANAIITSLLFFITIILHELSHAMVARARGLPVRSITLFALGGVAQIQNQAGEPSHLDRLPALAPDTPITDVIETMERKRLTRSQLRARDKSRDSLRAEGSCVGYRSRAVLEMQGRRISFVERASRRETRTAFSSEGG